MESVVYHYCNAEIFQKIISLKTIRMSDITKSNDSMEIRWIVKDIDEVFRDNWDHSYDEVFKQIGLDFTTITLLLKKFEDAYFGSGLLGEKRLYKYYVACFSMEPDLLSQWRGYADDGKGFSVGFDRVALEKYKEDSFNLLTVHSGFIDYSESNRKNLLISEVQNLISSLHKLSKEGVDRDSVLHLFKTLFQRLLEKSIFIKNPFFQEEKEWRLSYWSFEEYESNNDDVLVVNHGKPEQYKRGFMNRGDKMVSYFDLSFPQSIVREIVLGPKNQSDVSDIEVFLRNNGIACPLRRSVGTYV